jgi:hypothetical protein
MSRIYGGIHYRFDNLAGQWSGRRVADYITAHTLLANEELPQVRVEDGSGDTVRLCVLGQPGDRLILESTTDLVTWEAVTSVTASLGGVVVEGGTASVRDYRFYRVRAAPTEPGM